MKKPIIGFTSKNLVTPAKSTTATCMRYIELNPVRTGIVDHPRDSLWSSYHYNAVGQTNELLTPHALYRQLGASAGDRQAAYRGPFRHHITERTLEELREATNKAWVQ